MFERTQVHHIIPRHRGGTDAPENLIELTIEEHAEAHKQLWLMNRDWQDELAYRMLSGQISASEASLRAKAIGTSIGLQGNQHRKGKVFTPEQLEKIKAGIRNSQTPGRLAKLKEAGVKGSQRAAELGLNKLGGTHAGAFKKGESMWNGRRHTPEAIEKMRAARMGKSPWNKGLRSTRGFEEKPSMNSDV